MIVKVDEKKDRWHNIDNQVVSRMQIATLAAREQIGSFGNQMIEDAEYTSPNFFNTFGGVLEYGLIIFQPSTSTPWWFQIIISG